MKRIASALILLVAFACAGVTPRAQLVQTHQSLQTLFASVDDAERVLCFGTTVLPANPSRCSTEAALVAHLTNARHQAISRALVKAFDAQVALGAVIATWREGDPVDFSAIQTSADELDVQLKALNVSVPSVASLVRQAKKWADEINRIKKLLGVR